MHSRTPSYILPFSTYWIVQPSYLIVPHHTTILPYRTLSYILPHHTLDFLPHPTTTFFVLHVIVGQRRSWFRTAPRGRGLRLPLPSLPSPALHLLSRSLPLSLRLPTSHSVTLLNTSSVYQLSTLHQPATPVKMDDDQTSSSQAARPRYYAASSRTTPRTSASSKFPYSASFYNSTLLKQKEKPSIIDCCKDDFCLYDLSELGEQCDLETQEGGSLVSAAYCKRLLSQDDQSGCICSLS